MSLLMIYLFGNLTYFCPPLYNISGPPDLQIGIIFDYPFTSPSTHSILSVPYECLLKQLFHSYWHLLFRAFVVSYLDSFARVYLNLPKILFNNTSPAYNILPM